MPQPPLIFLIAGEASGDQLGADLMASLKVTQDVRFAGIGGDAMMAQGLTSLFPMQELSLIGIWSILRNLPSLLGRLKYTVETIKAMKPDVVLTIDAPEFNLRIQRRLHKLPNKPRLIHYVAPTVWAWRPGMAKKISGFLDRLLCLYPFEPPYFEKYGLNTTFVGHSLAKKPQSMTKKDPNLLCVLPGSRCSEVEKLLPIFGETLKLVIEDMPDLKVVIPTVPAVESLVREGVKNWSLEVKIVLGDESRDMAFQKATAAIAASGTVALQLAAANLPFLIAYKVDKFNEWVARLLFKTPWVCMVNILLVFQKFGPNFILTPRAKNLIPNPWIPEFLQKDCTAEKMAPIILNLLKDKKAQAFQKSAMDKAISLLQAPPDVAAKAVLEEIEITES